MDAVRLPTATLPIASPVREAKTHGYITDGLVFHLDGINKGAKEGIWVDLVSGVEFAPAGEVEWGPNYVAGLLAADVAVAFPSGTSTIECCIRNKIKIVSNSHFFQSGVCGSICMGIAGVGRLLISQCPNGGNYSFVDRDLFSAGVHVVSANKDLMLHNHRADYELRTLDYWINRYSHARAGNPAGTIEFYSLRIYDRLLTEEEMRRNQQTDLRRFRLALPEAATLELDVEEDYTDGAVGLGQYG